jgi:tape measure domain-containing protein
VSVVANVAINVDSSAAAQKLREFKNKSQQAEKAASKIGPATQQSFDAASASANKLTATVGKLAAAYLTLQTAQRAVQAGIKRIESERRLEILAKGFNEVAEAQAVAARAAKTFGISQTQANTEFARAFVRLRPLGVALKDIESAYIGFETAAKLSGASADEASSAWFQLTQALGSGTLRGQELNSVLTQTPIVVQAIAKEMGIGTEKIKELAAQGQITSDIVIRALRRIETEGADQLKEALGGPAAAVQELQVAFEDLQVAATKDLIPAIIGIVKELKNVLEGLAPVIRGLGSLAAETLGTIGDLINAATKPGAAAAAVSIKSGRLPLGMIGAEELFKGTSGAGGAGLEGIIAEARELEKLRKQDFTQVLLELMQNRLQRVEAAATPQARAGAAMPTPSMEVTGGSGGGGAGGGGGGGNAVREAQRAAEQIQRQIKAADDINFALKNRLAIAQATESVAKRMLEYDIRQNEIAKEYDELKKAAKSADELILINANQVIEQRIAQIEAEQQINDLLAERAVLVADVVRQSSMPTVYNELETQNAALQAILDKYPAIGAAADAAATLATSSMSEMIAGTKSVEQAFAEFLNAIGDALINTAKQMIAQYIAIGIARMFAGLGGSAGGFDPNAAGPFGGGGLSTALSSGFTARANGGPAVGGMPYLVGERGPELFVPGGSGGVMSNNDMRAAMGSRPGGANGSPVLNMSFQSSSINGVEYVSRDQLEQAMVATRRQAAKEGANRGMSMALDKLQQSPSTRSRLGIGGR